MTDGELYERLRVRTVDALKFAAEVAALRREREAQQGLDDLYPESRVGNVAKLAKRRARRRRAAHVARRSRRRNR
jgi:hypothetical protein